MYVCIVSYYVGLFWTHNIYCTSGHPETDPFVTLPEVSSIFSLKCFWGSEGPGQRVLFAVDCKAP